MYLNCLLQKICWCLPWKIPFGNCHYTTGCELCLLSDAICIEQCLTNLTCKKCGNAPSAPCVLPNSRKEILNMGHGFPHSGCCCCNCCKCCKCCCCCPKKEEPRKQCINIKVCCEEEKEEKKEPECPCCCD